MCEGIFCTLASGHHTHWWVKIGGESITRIGGKELEDMPLSDYVESLDAVAKSRYLDKLGILGLAATDDPYASGEFHWRPVEFGHIFCYV